MKNRRIQKQRETLLKKAIPIVILCLSSAFVGGIVALLSDPTLREINEKKGMCKLASPDHTCKITVHLDPLNQEIHLWQ